MRKILFICQIILSLLSFTITSFAIQKHTLSLSVEVNLPPDSIFEKSIQSSTFDTIFNLRQFEIALTDALKNLSNEIRLQDLFSNADIILSNPKTPEGILNIIVNFENFQRQEKNFEYVTNNLSGDYIKWGNEYIKVYAGEKYKVDYSSGKEVYINDPLGWYVKGYDGKYYMASTFYSKVPHTDISYVVKLRVDYLLYIGSELREKGSFDINYELEVVSHKYDPYNNKLLRYERSINELAKELARKVSLELANKFKKPSTVFGTIESVKFPRVLIDVGERDGVKVDYIFGVKDNEKLIAEIKVIRTGNDYSECEITYIRRDSELKVGNEVFLKKPDLVTPLGLKLHYITDTSFSLSNSLIALGLLAKELNIFRETTFAIEFGYIISLKDLLESEVNNSFFEMNFYFRLFGSDNLSTYFLAGFSTNPRVKSKIGMLLKLGIFGIEIFAPFDDLITTPSVESIRIGGGISW